MVHQPFPPNAIWDQRVQSTGAHDIAAYWLLAPDRCRLTPGRLTLLNAASFT